MGKQKTGRHIQLDSYTSVEKVVLIHAASFKWEVTPQTYKKDKKDIISKMVKEQAMKRTVILRENGRQLFGKGII